MVGVSGEYHYFGQSSCDLTKLLKLTSDDCYLAGKVSRSCEGQIQIVIKDHLASNENFQFACIFSAIFFFFLDH